MSHSAMDAFGLRTVAGVWGALVLLKTLRQERLPWLALRLATHSLLAQWLACMAQCRTSAYARFRELAAVAFTAHSALITVDGALNGGTNILERHSSQPLLLLALLSVYNSTVWICLYMLYARLSVHFNRVVLPCLALVPLLASRRVCLRMLEAPGVLQPLHSLYTHLSLLHGSLTSVGMLAEAQPEPLQQCLVVNAWAVSLFGVLLPLRVLQHWERQQSQQQQRRPQQEQEDQTQQQQPQPQQQQPHQQQVWQAWHLPFPLQSCLVWFASWALLTMPWQ